MSTRPHDGDQSSDAPPAKRQKTQAKVRKSPEYWFNSGNIVLVANKAVAFRVHGDVLGRKSQVLKDMLTLDTSGPKSEPETMEGCPVIHLTDRSDSLKIFLGLIYDSFEHLRKYAGTGLQWNVVRTMLILGKKYDVPEFYEEGLAALRAQYPKDVSEWDEREEMFSADDREKHLEVAKFTRTLGDADLHAAVLYECCGLDVAKLVSGPNALPPDDLIRTLKFAQSVQANWRKISSKLWDALEEIYVVCEECPSYSWHEAQTEAENWIVWDEDDLACGYLDDFVWKELMLHLGKAVSGFSAFCDRCEIAYDKELQRLRQQERDRLPQYFDLDANN